MTPTDTLTFSDDCTHLADLTRIEISEIQSEISDDVLEEVLGEYETMENPEPCNEMYPSIRNPLLGIEEESVGRSYEEACDTELILVFNVSVRAFCVPLTPATDNDFNPDSLYHNVEIQLLYPKLA
eukprot:768441-Hanusia_phi.AAC.21